MSLPSDANLHQDTTTSTKRPLTMPEAGQIPTMQEEDFSESECTNDTTDTTEENNVVDPRYLAYRRLYTATAYETQEGFSYTQDLETTVFPNGIVWTGYEKERFFGALQRVGRHRLDAIHERVPSKSMIEIADYIELLEAGSQRLGPIPDIYDCFDPSSEDFIPIAYEMSDDWIQVEELYSKQLATEEDEALSKRPICPPDRKSRLLKFGELYRARKRARVRANRGALDMFDFVRGRRPDEMLCPEQDDTDRALELFDIWELSNYMVHLNKDHTPPYPNVILAESLTFLYALVRQYISSLIMDLSAINRKSPKQRITDEDVQDLLDQYPSLTYDPFDEDTPLAIICQNNNRDSDEGEMEEDDEEPLLDFSIQNNKQEDDLLKSYDTRDEILQAGLELRDKTYESLLYKFLSSPLSK